MRRSVKIYLIIGFLGLVASAAVQDSERKASPASCPVCDVDYCPKTPRECLHELVRDRCGCCKEGVCLLREKEKCLNLKIFKNIKEANMKRFSVCGEYMECLLREDLKAGEAEESVCQCQRQEVSCGKDNATYPSLCQLHEAGTELEHSGACTTPPEIVSELKVAPTLEHEKFSLNCEAKGFPVPHVLWKFEGLNGLFKSLPGDDASIAVHSRGGPEPFTITSWLMIEALRPSDAGTYICEAQNSEGVARSVASVYVSQQKS